MARITKIAAIVAASAFIADAFTGMCNELIIKSLFVEFRSHLTVLLQYPVQYPICQDIVLAV